MKLPDSLNVVLAVAGLSWAAGSAFAQPAAPAPDQPATTFEVYGSLIPFLELARTSKATTPAPTGAATQVGAAAYTGTNILGRMVLDPSTSNLGFRGGVDIAPNLAVVYQIESAVPIDGAAAAVGVAGRNTQLGVTGKWGTAFFGNWDTPYKWSSNAVVNPIKAGFLADFNNILHNPGFGVSSVSGGPTRANAVGDAAFYRRAGNSLQYWSPPFSGVSFRIGYSINEGRTNRTPGNASPSIQPTIFSTALAFDQGPIKLRYAYEAHLDYFAMAQMGGTQPSISNKSSLDQGHEGLAQYTHAAPGFDTRIVGVFEYLSYTSDDNTVNAAMTPVPKKYSRPAFYVLADQAFGKSHLWASYGWAGAGSCSIVSGANCSTSGFGAYLLTAGYLYRFSRNTDFFVAAYRVTNKSSSTYTPSPALNGANAPGADTDAIGIGMVHQFSWKAGPPAKATGAAAPKPSPGTLPPPDPVPPAPAPAPGEPAPGTPPTPPPASPPG